MATTPAAGFFAQPVDIEHMVEDETRDEYGNVVLVPRPVRSTVRGYLAQQWRGEVGPDQVERERFVLYLQGTVAIDANDIVTVDGREYHVIGEPWRVVHPLTRRVDHIEATVERSR